MMSGLYDERAEKAVWNGWMIGLCGEGVLLGAQHSRHGINSIVVPTRPGSLFNQDGILEARAAFRYQVEKHNNRTTSASSDFKLDFYEKILDVKDQFQLIRTGIGATSEVLVGNRHRKGGVQLAPGSIQLAPNPMRIPVGLKHIGVSSS